MLDSEIDHIIHLEAAGKADWRSVVAFYARQLLKELRLVGGYEFLYPAVRDFIKFHLFEPRMDTDKHGSDGNQESPSSGKIRVHPRSSVVPSSDPFFDGRKAGRLVAIGPINLPVGRLFVEEVITECRKRGASRADILAVEFEMGLFPAVLDEAKRKGIDIAPKIIPPEVFDKRAVDKGQVRFSDVAFVEANPRYDSKNKLALTIELTDTVAVKVIDIFGNDTMALIPVNVG